MVQEIESTAAGAFVTCRADFADDAGGSGEIFDADWMGVGQGWERRVCGEVEEGCQL